MSATRHHARIWAVTAGATAKGRKGEAWNMARAVMERADGAWTREHAVSGLSSGEGLIWAVRDPIIGRVRVKGEGGGLAYQEQETDPGIADKRLLVLGTEFSSVLKVLGREGNTLSPTLRQAWGRGDLRSLTKNSPAQATGAHITVLAHGVAEEIRRYLVESEIAGGTANRFLWVCVRRSQLLPFGGNVTPELLTPLAEGVREALDFAAAAGRMTWSQEAAALWREVYPALSAARPGLAGAVCARAEAHTLRLAMTYALLDCTATIQPPHLLAALAVWRYCEASAAWLFGDRLGDPVAAAMLTALRERGRMTRTQIRDQLRRNYPAERIDAALRKLLELGLAEFDRVGTGERGRPTEVWSPVR